MNNAADKPLPLTALLSIKGELKATEKGLPEGPTKRLYVSLIEQIEAYFDDMETMGN